MIIINLALAVTVVIMVVKYTTEEDGYNDSIRNKTCDPNIYDIANSYNSDCTSGHVCKASKLNKKQRKPLN